MPPAARDSGRSTSRTVLEITLIAAVIYFLLGAPGLPSDLLSSSSTEKHVPVSDDQTAKEKVKSIVYPSKDLDCPRHDWTTAIVSTSPLVLYLDGFLSDQEVKELIELSNPTYTPSTLFSAGSKESLDSTIRHSEKSLLPRTNTVRCIEARALALQGWPRDTFIERLWTQRYNVSGHYSLHYDWGAASPRARRASSFMVYLNGGEGEELEGGGTHFPRLRHPRSTGDAAGGEKWCDYVECAAEGGGRDGVTFRPRGGSAVFWQNFDENGRGYKETIHAGLPVTKGQKIGLNIWSWYQAGHQIPPEAEQDEQEAGERADHIEVSSSKHEL